MDNNFHLLTFATKYSRVPAEGIAKRRYDAVMEVWKSPVIIDIKWYKWIIDAFDEQASKIWITILACNIIPDHVHVVVYSNGKKISEIVQKLKWYSAYVYNKTFARKGPLRTSWYSDTYINTEDRLQKAIIYVQNNHLKHQEKWWNIWDSDADLKKLLTDMQKRYHNNLAL